jgi:hypothetical protein
MKVIPKTEEQRTEMLARLTYLLSNLRAFQRDSEEIAPNKRKESDVKMWEYRCDEFLKDIGATDFESLSSLINQLTIKNESSVG